MKAEIYTSIFFLFRLSFEDWSLHQKNQRKIKNISQQSIRKIKNHSTKHKKNKKSSKEEGGDDASDDEIDDEEDDCNYIFPCNRWLAKGEDDGQIIRELIPYDSTGTKARRNTLSCKLGFNVN